MTTLTFWQDVCYWLIAALLAGFAILDGFDLGVGMMLPFVSKKDEEKKTLLYAVWPFWDGNELWGLVAGAVLFAAFPPIFAQAMSVFYIPVILLFVCLIYRGVAFELWFHFEKRRRLWEALNLTASAFLPVAIGLALGAAVNGVPLDEKGRLAGGIAAVLNPYSASLALLFVSVMLLSGSAYASLKTSGPVRERAGQFLGRFFWLALAAALLWGTLTFALFPVASKPLVWVGAAAALVSLFAVRFFHGRGRALGAFVAASLSSAAVFLTLGGLQYPKILTAAGGAGRAVTAADAASPEKTLATVAVLAAFGMALVAGYTVFVHRALRGKGASLEY